MVELERYLGDTTLALNQPVHPDGGQASVLKSQTYSE